MSSFEFLLILFHKILLMKKLNYKKPSLIVNLIKTPLYQPADMHTFKNIQIYLRNVYHCVGIHSLANLQILVLNHFRNTYIRVHTYCGEVL